MFMQGSWHVCFFSGLFSSSYLSNQSYAWERRLKNLRGNLCSKKNGSALRRSNATQKEVTRSDKGRVQDGNSGYTS